MNGVAIPPMQVFLSELKRQQSAMVRLLGRFVRAESPSFDKAAVDQFGRLVAAEWRRRGARVSFLRQSVRGDHVRAELWQGHGRSAGQIMVLGHLDTVYERGTLEKMPFRVAGGRAWGPGTFDMKGGHVMALFAADALRRARVPLQKRLVFLWNSDEEIGSESSRRIIEQEARRSDAVLVLEPSFGPGGRLKTQRKGVGMVRIIVRGRAAHAGINPEEGVNAVHELALQIERLRRMNDPRRGITVQTTVVEAGKFSNVIPEVARACVDVRVARLQDAALLHRKLHALRPILRGAHLAVRGGVTRPPLERTAAVRRLFRHAQLLADEIGLELGEASSGGGSDGNFCAALGVPTLDGLGAVGDGAHSPREYALIRALPERAALLAGLLASL
jgi:glutamate carboxypeptidase